MAPAVVARSHPAVVPRSHPAAVALRRAEHRKRAGELAKGLMDEVRVLKAMKILGGLLGDQAVSADDISALAKLPGRPYLQAQLVGSLQAPLGQMVGLLDAPFRNLVHVLTARSA